MTENTIIANNGSSIVLYTTDDGNTQLEVKLDKDTVWLTQSQMAQLFGRDRTVIARHIRNIFKEGELDENITCAKFAHMGTDQDQTYETKMYSLDVIISVGYRVKSIKGTKFRIWATSVIKQYLIKGYAVDRRRLDHYDELKDVVRLMSRALSLQEKVTDSEYDG
ncbi:MAG: virulence RhuM family protein, partial [Candidatus Limisoma sp.]